MPCLWQGKAKHATVDDRVRFSNTQAYLYLQFTIRVGIQILVSIFVFEQAYNLIQRLSIILKLLNYLILHTI